MPGTASFSLARRPGRPPSFRDVARTVILSIRSALHARSFACHGKNALFLGNKGEDIGCPSRRYMIFHDYGNNNSVNLRRYRLSLTPSTSLYRANTSENVRKRERSSQHGLRQARYKRLLYGT